MRCRESDWRCANQTRSLVFVLWSLFVFWLVPGPWSCPPRISKNKDQSSKTKDQKPNPFDCIQAIESHYRSNQIESTSVPFCFSLASALVDLCVGPIQAAHA